MTPKIGKGNVWIEESWKLYANPSVSEGITIAERLEGTKVTS
jgi:hypothetical protein